MENSELIKNFERIRDYLRQMYIYGFHSRSRMRLKSPRSYDNERRRLESLMEEYLSCRREESGKQFFITMDSRNLTRNPFYNAFKAKSFTDKDISLHFFVMDCFSSNKEYMLCELMDELTEHYFCHFSEMEIPDISTLRKKLKEYESIGLLKIQKRAKEYVYAINEDDPDLNPWQDALSFYSECAPMGVIGSFLLDRLPERPGIFRFKHHYPVQALDSQIMFTLLDAMNRHQWVDLTLHKLFIKTEKKQKMYPCRIYISAQTGRQYLLGYSKKEQRFRFCRLDVIHKVKPDAEEPMHEVFMEKMHLFSKNAWGVSAKKDGTVDHLEMTVFAQDDEPFILKRLMREKRNGTVTVLDKNTYLYTADVYDALEMLPWIRTFIGRITRLDCTNKELSARFYQDLDAMASLYGGK